MLNCGTNREKQREKVQRLSELKDFFEEIMSRAEYLLKYLTRNDVTPLNKGHFWWISTEVLLAEHIISVPSVLFLAP